MNATMMDEAGLAGASTAALRQAMVASQLRTNEVSDPRVVAAMALVPRELYLPNNAAALAYRDTVAPLGQGRHANLPMATGRLLTEAYLTAEDRVLLIGAAGGYTAAVLAEIVAHVTAVESDPALAAWARNALAGLTSVNLVEGPLDEGHAPGAPYNVLVVDGAVEQLPDRLTEQVRIGGRIVTGLVDCGVTRLAAGRRGPGGVGLADFADAECAVLPGFAPPPRFRF